MNSTFVPGVQKTIRVSLLAALVTTAMLLLPSSAAAATETFEIDPVHSAVGFSVKHLFSRVPGFFDEFEGTIILDREDWSKSSVNISITTARWQTSAAATIGWEHQ